MRGLASHGKAAARPSSCFVGPLTCPTSGTGGRGAEVGGNFSLNTAEVLQIAVGGAGGVGSNGGGGTFVLGPGNAPLGYFE
jgi:hypothetical protein